MFRRTSTQTRLRPVRLEMDRYAQIQAVEDLGLIDSDRTDDLVGVTEKQETPDDGAPTPDVARGFNPATS